MQREYTVEQVFVRSRGGRAEIALVMVAPSGATKRETFQPETADPAAALVQVARALALRRDVEAVAGARLRREAAGGLRDDDALKAHFAAAFAEARQ